MWILTTKVVTFSGTSIVTMEQVVAFTSYNVEVSVLNVTLDDPKNE